MTKKNKRRVIQITEKTRDLLKSKTKSGTTYDDLIREMLEKKPTEKITAHERQIAEMALSLRKGEAMEFTMKKKYFDEKEKTRKAKA